MERVGGYTFDRLRDELALRIAAVPEFRAKLADSQLNLDSDAEGLRGCRQPACRMRLKRFDGGRALSR